MRNELQSLLNENKNLTGFSTAGKMEFNTIDELPVAVPQYEIPHYHRPTVDGQIASWLDEGVIEVVRDKCRYNNPLLVVPKYDT